ncbi:MAG: ribosomal protein L7/L12 [Bacteroidia bacterium]|nr:ribosomal protein L7/L12 [Bacteroidia bacterium]
MKMLKSLTLISALLILTTALMAQVSEGVQAYAKKESGNALTITLEGQPKNVAEVLNRKFKAETNSKGKAMRGIKSLSGGMKTFTGVRYSAISGSTMDYTYRVEKAKGTKDHSVVHIWMSTGNNNFIDSGSYPDEIDYAMDMMEGLQHEVSVYEFELMIEEQEKVASNAVKTHDRLVKDSIKLEDQLAKLLDQIEQNKADRAAQLIAISQEEQKLADFRVDFEELRTGIRPEESINIDEVARKDEMERTTDEVEEMKEEKTKKVESNKEKNKEDNSRELYRSQESFEVMLLDAGDSKFNVIKEIKSITGMSMGEAKKMVDGLEDGPVTIKKGISADEAEVLKEILEEAGAKVEIN